MTRIINITIATALLGGASAAILAEESPVLEEIVVTAEKREAPVSSVPLAVSAFDGAALDAQGELKLEDFIDQAPGVSNRPTGNGFAKVEIRGVSSSTGDGTIGFYLDEVPFSFLGSTISPNMASYDLERVEVLRGPQGTLYGQGSMGGTIKLITKAPDLGTMSAKADVSAGAQRDGSPVYAYNGAVNLPIIDGKLALRLVAGYDDTGGFLDDRRTGRRDVNDAQARNFRAKLLYKATDALSITASAWVERDRSNFSLGGYADRTLESGPGIDFLHIDTDAYNLLVNWRLPFADLVSSSSYQKFKYVSSNNSTVISTGASTDVTSDSDVADRSYSQEVRLVSSGKGPLKWSVGGMYADTRADEAALVNADTTVPDTVIADSITDASAITTSKNWSLFGETSYQLFGGFLVPTLGLRYFDDRRAGTGVTNTTEILTFLIPGIAGSTTVTPGTPEAAAGTFTSVDPRFNLAFHWTDKWLSYINVAKGFRSGSANSAEATAIAASYGVSAGIVKPDTIWTSELGSKATLANGKVSLDGAAYYSDWNHIQLSVTDPTTQTSFTVNGGEAHLKGFEYGLAFRPVAGLSLTLSGSFSQSALSRVDPNLASLTFLHAGTPLDYVPKNQVNASGTYRWNLGWGKRLQGFFYAAVDHHSSLTSTTTSGTLKGDPITSANLRLGVQSNRWGTYLYVTNLFDENAAVTLNSDTTAVRLAPRTIGLALHYGFD